MLPGVGTRELWAVGQETGEALPCLGALWLGLLCVRFGWLGLVAHDQRQIMKGVRKRSQEKSSLMGDSDWATHEQVRKSGMLKKKPGSIFLGEHGGKELFYNGENSVSVLAPPGAGKSTCFAAQFLLRTEHNFVYVNDPKMELLLVCGEDLKRRGYRLLTISPWFESFAEQFGGKVEARDDGVDPCSFLDASSPCIIDDARLLATLLIPVKTKESATAKFFDEFSRSILCAFMLLILSEKGRVTLPELRSRIMAPEEDIEADIAKMMTSDAFSGVLREEGARLHSPKMNSDREWSGGISGAMQALKPYDKHGPLGRSVEKAGVDFRTAGDQKSVVFFVQPPERVDSHEGYGSMVMVLAIEQQARIRRRKKGCIFLLDELQASPSALLPVLRSIALYRGAGLQFLCLFQFMAALSRHLGDSWREFLSVDVFTTFGAPTDPETLDIISRLSGQTTVRGTSFNSDAERLAGGEVGVSMGMSEVARPLLTASEARTMDKSSAVIFTSNLPPIKAKKQSYLSNKKLKKRASRNPYYD